MKVNILFAGVGGQGVLRASHILGEAAIEDGRDVKVGESYGAAMRGGSVASHVRIGSDIYSPINSENSADIIVALEPMEGVRYAAKFLSKNGLFLANEETVPSYDVKIGEAKYPSLEKIKKTLRELSEVKMFNATSLANEAGNVKTMNIVMLGALHQAGELKIEKNTLQEVVKSNSPKGTEEANLQALKLGMNELRSKNK